MLRITELKLPLDHDDDALATAILARLGIAADELIGYTVAKRSYDARKRGAIVLIYSVDVDTPREAELLARLQQAPGAAGSKVMPTPDTTYKFVATAPAQLPPAGVIRRLQGVILVDVHPVAERAAIDRIEELVR